MLSEIFVSALLASTAQCFAAQQADVEAQSISITYNITVTRKRVPSQLIQLLLGPSGQAEPFGLNVFEVPATGDSLAAVESGPASPEVENAWRRFLQKYRPNGYKSKEDEFQHRTAFHATYATIDEHNGRFDVGLESFRMGVNRFSDMTNREKQSRPRCFRPGRRSNRNPFGAFLPPLNAVIPQTIDWRTLGFVTPVKDQIHCGSCYAFAATGALEGQHFRKSKQLVELSEQNLIDCTQADPYNNGGCQGGLMNSCFQYVKDVGGIDKELLYPYEDRDNATCRFNISAVGATDVGFQQIAGGNETELLIAVATMGPVAVAIKSPDSLFKYVGGIYVNSECANVQPDELNHAVLVVGYGTDRLTGINYWLIKNSWSPFWGEEGYFRLPRNANYCGIAYNASFPLV